MKQISSFSVPQDTNEEMYDDEMVEPMTESEILQMQNDGCRDDGRALTAEEIDAVNTKVHAYNLRTS